MKLSYTQRSVAFAFLSLWFCIVPSNTEAQTFSVDTLLFNGNVDKYINIVFLGDGYTAGQQDIFSDNTLAVMDYLFSVEPFSAYQSYFNVFAVVVPSAETGAKHPRTASDCPPEHQHPTLEVNNYFHSTFDYFGIHRLLVPTNFAAVNTVLMVNFPLFDQALMLVNTPFYGGSGGTYATSSMHEQAFEIMVHEIGHSFADLADEYWAGDIYAAEKPNMTQNNNPNTVKWKNWIGVDGVGIYQHCCGGNSSQWYRPHQNCKMRYLGVDFCRVCQEAFVLTIWQKFGSPISQFYPAESDLVMDTDSLPFALSVLHNTGNTLRVKWLLNNEKIAENTDSIYLTPALLSAGNNTLVAEILDTTAYVRADHHPSVNTFRATWNVFYQPVNLNEPENERQIRVYPNPVSDELVIEVDGNHQNLVYHIYNSAGVKVYEGTMTNRTTINISGFMPGVYVLRLENGNKAEFRKVIKE